MTDVAPVEANQARLGSLLLRHRVDAGRSLESIVVGTRAGFTVDELRAIEAGERAVDPDTFETLLGLYCLDRRMLSANGGELVLDLTQRNLHVGDWFISFDSPAADEVLDGYLDLVRTMRGLSSQRDVTLRTDDLVVLGDALAESPEVLRRRLLERIESPSLAARLSERFGFIAGLLVVAAVAAAGAVFLFADSAPSQSELADEVMAVTAVNQLVTAPEAAALLGAVGAEAEPIVLPTRAQAIEDAIPWDFRAALPGWRVRYAASHPEWRGVTNSIDRSVTLFDRPGSTIDEAAAVLVHELGHAIDLERLDDEQRLAWLELRGMPEVWWADEGMSDFSVGAGDFAEAVAAFVVGAPSESDYGEFTDEQLAFVAAVLATDA